MDAPFAPNPERGARWTIGLTDLHTFKFLWCCWRKQYVHALSSKSANRSPRAELELWAFHRLGAHRTVADAHHPGGGWRTSFAKAVAHAACGERAAAEGAVALFTAQRAPTPQHLSLAEALLPFMPETASRLIEGRSDVPAALRVAVSLRCGNLQDAQRLLDGLRPPSFAAQPELHLFRTNAGGGSPAEQLERLNAFLQAHRLPVLQLRDPRRPPSAGNLLPAEPVAAVHGPLVSVLMTTHRTGARAVAAVESVLAQSYRDLELIVVDDASNDGTLEQLQAVASQDPRVRLLPLRRNVGTYAAKLIGLRLARGEFITCHDSDDWSHPQKIARQVAPLTMDDRLVCTVSSWVRIQDDGHFYARPVHPLMRINPSSPLFRRERVLREAGAWDCVRTGADSEFLARLKLVFGAKAVKKVGQPLSLGSHRPDSLMTAPGTGYSQTGMSPQRLAYWEAWNWWHIETLAQRRVPFVPFDLEAAARHRPFDVPESLKVRLEDVEACLRAIEPTGSR